MKLVVLDRDGVITRDTGGIITSAKQIEPIEGSLAAIARLNQAGIKVALATNHSGIARGLLDMDTLHAIHQHVASLLQQVGGHFNMVAFCPHSDANECRCRKPAPGMLYSISERLNIEPNQSVMVGDSLKDVQAAMAAAFHPALVKTGNGQATLDNNKGLEHIPAYENLAVFVDELLESLNTAAD
jgi:D-glycero-D-manno-heptose 1,7-bisphosphate phosphatase